MAAKAKVSLRHSEGEGFKFPPAFRLLLTEGLVFWVQSFVVFFQADRDDSRRKWGK